MNIPIIYQDENFLAVDKPIDLAVHKNKHMPHDASYLTKVVGDQIGQWVYNVHRLDAKTSGLILLALSPEAAKLLTQLFERRSISKTYKAILKGLPGEGTFSAQVVDRKKRGKRVDALTNFSTLDQIETDYESKGIENIPFSLVELKPTTGRWHQLRQHCAQQRFDIIGDTQHGDWTLNRLVTEKTEVKRLCLHASDLSFTSPFTEEVLNFSSELPEAFERVWLGSKKS